MRSTLFVCLLAASLPVAGFDPKDKKPVEEVNAVQPVTGVRTSLAISYPEGPTVGVKFLGTERLPRASGQAKVQRKRGTTEIEVELDEMKPATSFGGDLATYVLWTVAPEGHVHNAGEFILRGNRSKLNVSTPLQAFGMFVTAEPHYLVSAPSRMVVLENSRPTGNLTVQMMNVSNITYKGFQGEYARERESLYRMPEVKGEIRSDLRQAQVAVKLAKAAGAEEYAPEELEKAEQSLRRTIDAAESRIAESQLMIIGHETVRLAVDAQKKAEERAFQAALDAERKAKAEEMRRLELDVEYTQSDAEQAKALAAQRELERQIEENARKLAMKEAAEAALEAEKADRRAQEEAARRAEAEQEALAARQHAEQMAALRAKAEADAREAQEAALLAKNLREQALGERMQAEQEAQRARDAAAELAAMRARAEREARQARDEAERIRQEREEDRRRLQAALARVVETRETARGLVVNLPDILFEFGKDKLQPQAREVLSKVCGIFLVTQGYRLNMEGHTDSVGSDEFNLKLSERRAQNVFDFLAECGVPKEGMTARGFGEMNPIAANDTAQGRSKNRRVEIVIEDTQAVSATLLQ